MVENNTEGFLEIKVFANSQLNDCRKIKDMMEQEALKYLKAGFGKSHKDPLKVMQKLKKYTQNCSLWKSVKFIFSFD